jgi:hypothetical protein
MPTLSRATTVILPNSLMEAITLSQTDTTESLVTSVTTSFNEYINNQDVVKVVSTTTTPAAELLTSSAAKPLNMIDVQTSMEQLVRHMNCERGCERLSCENDKLRLQLDKALQANVNLTQTIADLVKQQGEWTQIWRNEHKQRDESTSNINMTPKSTSESESSVWPWGSSSCMPGRMIVVNDEYFPMSYPVTTTSTNVTGVTWATRLPRVVSQYSSNTTSPQTIGELSTDALFAHICEPNVTISCSSVATVGRSSTERPSFADTLAKILTPKPKVSTTRTTSNSKARYNMTTPSSTTASLPRMSSNRATEDIMSLSTSCSPGRMSKKRPK